MSDCDTDMERFIALQVKLEGLVIEDPRITPRAIAALQHFVHTATEWPTTKSVTAIYDTANDNQHLLRYLLGFDITRRDPQALQILAAFPDCFVGSTIQPIVALSVVRAKSTTLAKARGWTNDAGDLGECPWSFGALTVLQIPYLEFNTNRKSHLIPKEVLPDNIDEKSPQGTTIFIDECDYVVLENNLRRHVMIVTLAIFVNADA